MRERLHASEGDVFAAALFLCMLVIGRAFQFVVACEEREEKRSGLETESACTQKEERAATCYCCLPLPATHYISFLSSPCCCVGNRYICILLRPSGSDPVLETDIYVDVGVFLCVCAFFFWEVNDGGVSFFSRRDEVYN